MSDQPSGRRTRSQRRTRREEETSEEQRIAVDFATSWSDLQEQEAELGPVSRVELEIPSEDSSESSQDISESSLLSSGNDKMSGQSVPSARNLAATVEIAGESLVLAAQPNAVSTEVKPLYKKQDRYTMDSSDRASLFKEAKKSILETKLQQQSLIATDEDAMDDTVMLKDQLTKLSSHIKEFDMEDVFHIVDYSERDPTQVIGVSNLLTEYSSLTPKKVARSNKWHRVYLDQVQQPWIEDNQNLTFEFLRANMTDSLYGKVMETYEEYEASERGGPLLLAIALEHLQKNTEEQCVNLAERIRHMSITDYAGEDIPKVVTLLRASIKRLRDAHVAYTADGTAIHKYLPTDIVKTLLKLFQTSTVEDFNKVFSLMESIRTVAAHTSEAKTQKDDLTVEHILQVAESKYDELISTSLWTGVTSPGKSVFLSGTGTIRCWNCDREGHGVEKCPEPKQPEHIAQRKKAFRENKVKAKGSRQQSKGHRRRGGKGGTGDNTSGKGVPGATSGKFARPSQGEHGKRVIDGVQWKYNFTKKQWFKTNTLSSEPAQCPQAQVAVPLSDTTSSTTTSTLTQNTQPCTQPVARVAGVSAETTHTQALRTAAAIRARDTVSLLAAQLQEMDSLN
jgi:hypothetical protein